MTELTDTPNQMYQTNVLFFDTETSGMVEWKRPAGPHQPHIVQLAALLVGGRTGDELTYKAVIRPEGWTISKEAEAVHGYSTERAVMDGVELWRAMWEFDRLIGRAGMVVAHNIKFDLLLVESEMIRLRLPLRWPSQQFCTMDATTDICKLPGYYGQYKWPKLEEAYEHFFKKKLEGAHDAMTDVRACREVFDVVMRQKTQESNDRKLNF